LKRTSFGQRLYALSFEGDLKEKGLKLKSRRSTPTFAF